MRFKFIQPSSALLLIVAVFVLYLGAKEQLNLYIHPRYIVFTILMSAIALILVVADASLNKKKPPSKSSPVILAPMIFMLLIALFPARTLTSATVSQRLTDSGSIVVNTDNKPINSLFSSSSRGLKIVDWSRLLEVNDDPAYYQNRTVNISGFVYDADLGNDTVWLARFVLTCCAVDAQPAGIPLRLENWQADFEEDQWLEVEGEFALSNTSEGEMLVLTPSSVNRIEQPENPYAN